MSRKVINIVPQKTKSNYFDFSIPETEPITALENRVYYNIQLSSDFDVNADCNIAKVLIDNTEIELKFIKTFELIMEEDGIKGGIFCYNAFSLGFSRVVFTLQIIYNFTNNTMENVDFAQTVVLVS